MVVFNQEMIAIRSMQCGKFVSPKDILERSFLKEHGTRYHEKNI